MIKKLLLIFSLCLVNINVAGGMVIEDDETFTVVGSTSIMTTMINIDSIKQRNDIMFAKTISIFNKDQSNLIENKPIAAIVKYSRYDCINKKMYIDLSLLLDNTMNLIQQDKIAKEWFEVKENTIGFLELQFVCNNKIKYIFV